MTLDLAWLYSWIPSWSHPYLRWVAGEWPTGDEQAMYAKAAELVQIASEVRTMAAHAGDVTVTVAASMDPAARAAFLRHFDRSVGQNLRTWASDAERAGAKLKARGLAVETAKLAIAVALYQLIFILLWIFVVAVWTDGASLSRVGPVVERTKLTVAGILKRLAIFGAISGGTNLLEQGVEIAEDHRDGVDWGAAAEAFGEGALTGVFFEGAHVAVDRLAGTAETALGRTALGAVEGGVAGAGSAAVVMGLSVPFGGQFTLSGLEQGAVSGAVMGAVSATAPPRAEPGGAEPGRAGSGSDEPSAGGGEPPEDPASRLDWEPRPIGSGPNAADGVVLSVLRDPGDQGAVEALRRAIDPSGATEVRVTPGGGGTEIKVFLGDSSDYRSSEITATVTGVRDGVPEVALQSFFGTKPDAEGALAGRYSEAWANLRQVLAEGGPFKVVGSTAWHYWSTHPDSFGERPLPAAELDVIRTAGDQAARNGELSGGGLDQWLRSRGSGMASEIGANPAHDRSGDWIVHAGLVGDGPPRVTGEAGAVLVDRHGAEAPAAEGPAVTLSHRVGGETRLIEVSPGRAVVLGRDAASPWNDLITAPDAQVIVTVAEDGTPYLYDPAASGTAYRGDAALGSWTRLNGGDAVRLGRDFTFTVETPPGGPPGISGILGGDPVGHTVALPPGELARMPGDEEVQAITTPVRVAETRSPERRYYDMVLSPEDPATPTAARLLSGLMRSSTADIARATRGGLGHMVGDPNSVLQVIEYRELPGEVDIRFSTAPPGGDFADEAYRLTDGSYGAYVSRALSLDDPEAAGALRDIVVGKLLHQWVEQGDSMMAMQEVARDVFNLDTPRAPIPPEVLDDLSRNAGVYSDMLRAQYEATQQDLAERGIGELVLYRGLKWWQDERSPVPDWARGTDGSEVPMSGMYPLASWTSDPEAAESFAGSRGSAGAVIGARVPASRVLSYPWTGIGASDYREWVVLTSPGNVTLVRGAGPSAG